MSAESIGLAQELCPASSSGEESELRGVKSSPTIHSPLSNGLVVAVDLDDVLCQTNVTIAAWHNETYGTNIDISTFYYHYYWKNPGWGTPAEAFQKVSKFYSLGRINSASPVPGAREGIIALREMGYRLVIVSARLKHLEADTSVWVQQHFPNIFDAVICTGQFGDHVNPVPSSEPVKKTVTKSSKPQVCKELGAQLLIDDSAENAFVCARHEDPIRVLLFGEYQWNRRLCSPDDLHDDMSFDRRLQREGGREFWRDDEVEIPENAPLWRVKDWTEVLRWISRAREEGRM